MAARGRPKKIVEEVHTKAVEKAPTVVVEPKEEIFKELVVEEAPKPVGLVLKKKFTTNLKEGDVLTQEQYNDLKARGVDIDPYLR